MTAVFSANSWVGHEFVFSSNLCSLMHAWAVSSNRLYIVQDHLLFRKPNVKSAT